MPVVHPETALAPYLRGELTGPERERVAAHLESCGQCRESADSFRALLAELASRLDELPAPPSGYRAELRRKLDARLERRSWRSPASWWSPAYGWAGLATATAAALALWLTLPGLRPSPPAPGDDDQIALEQQMAVTDVGLLRNYGVVQSLDMLENYDVIEHLDELRPAPKPSDAVRS
jgi:anti-sigma factor RsiW